MHVAYSSRDLLLMNKYSLDPSTKIITMSNHDGKEAVAIRRYQHPLKDHAHKDINPPASYASRNVIEYSS